MKYNTKKRLLVYCVYSKNHEIEDYRIHVLEQLKPLCSRIVVVVNGMLNKDSIKRLETITEEVVFRKNYGRDYGAYQMIVLEYLNDKDIIGYDSIIFCNDTFYGFFYPIKNVFDTMDEKDCDIWGLNISDRGILVHIQSYFLVFNNRVLKEGLLKEYFSTNNVIDNTLGECAALMEPRLYKWFVSKGAKMRSYMDLGNISIYRSLYESIIMKGFFILKKKSAYSSVACSDEVKEVIDYIYKNSLYPYDDLKKIKFTNDIIESPPSKKLSKSKITEEILLEFAKKDFYIFGNGLIAKLIYYTYFEGNSKFKGFVISGKGYGEGFINVSGIPRNARVILGVREDLQDEVKSYLNDDMEVLELWKSD